VTDDELHSASGAIRVVGGSPDAAELAALTAVLSASFDEAIHTPRRVAESAPSGWRRSQLAMRQTLPYNDWRRSGWL